MVDFAPSMVSRVKAIQMVYQMSDVYQNCLKVCQYRSWLIVFKKLENF